MTDTCDICGSDAVARRQEINGSTLARCRACAPHRSRRERALESLFARVAVVGAPLVAVAHLWGGVLGSWSTAETFERTATAIGADPSHWIVQFHLEFFRSLDVLAEWLITGLSVVLLVGYALVAVMYLAGRFRE
ncbi:hypothetical protein [Natrinema pallidum]|uniref:Uncharacterized protein n=1 Tax=Natrinema pallidum TaxID=69527 RepID=A0A4P9TJR7_9EURY|nr:hypothetical protein [Natrinema pallidum]QCW05248.1 hypothetical protein FGF80_18540 [Natrinema pallidum]